MRIYTAQESFSSTNRYGESKSLTRIVSYANPVKIRHQQEQRFRKIIELIQRT